MEEEDGEEDGQDGWWRGMKLSNVNGNVTKLKSALSSFRSKSEIFSINVNGGKNFSKMKSIFPFSFEFKISYMTFQSYASNLKIYLYFSNICINSLRRHRHTLRFDA